MNNAEVAHRWAQRRGDSGKGSNFYYNGDTIYSYGPHFAVARHMDSPKGVHFVVRSVATRSISTTRHRNLVARALPSDIPRIFAEPTGNVREWVQELQRRCADLYEKFKRARENKPWFAQGFQTGAAQLRFLKDQYDLDIVVPEIAGMEKLLKEQEEREAKRERARGGSK